MAGFVGARVTRINIPETGSPYSSGDYDGDGKSELLFRHSGHNQDGYRLVIGDLRRMVEYVWRYH
jgi:hypothetical protein